MRMIEQELVRVLEEFKTHNNHTDEELLGSLEIVRVWYRKKIYKKK